MFFDFPTYNLLLLFTTILLLFCIFYIILPLLRLYSIKSHGAEIYFFPITGLFQYWKSSLKNKGDSMGYSKRAPKVSPDPKFLLTNLGQKIVFNFRDVAHVKEFYKNQDCYEKADFLASLKLLLGNGLLLSEGAVWKRHRKIVSNSFHFELLKSNISSIQEIARTHFDKLPEEDRANFNLLDEIQAITGETIGSLFFGKYLNNYTCEQKLLTLCLADLLIELQALSQTAPIIIFGPRIMNLPLFPKYRHMMQRIDNFRQTCKCIINDRRSEPTQSNDMLGSLLKTQEESDPDKAFTDEEIIDEFVTFFVAGMDTTGHLISMTLYNLIVYPKYLQSLKEERELTYNVKVDADSLQKMDMLHCLLKETLRHYNPTSGVMLRKVVKPHKVVDVELKKGDLARIDFFSLFVDGRYFENPDKFEPMRWKESSQKVDSYAFTPFSAGARNCIGQHLAIFEAKVIISEFLEKFDFKMKDENYELEMIHRFSYEPVVPIMLELSPKSIVK